MNEIRPRRFVTTQWSLVNQAKGDDAGRASARAALGELCRLYWYPLYAFVRSEGHPADQAQDLTQAFFARILESAGFASADRSKGRFRSYLLGAMKNFLANEWHRARTQKRGGQFQFVEWNSAELETRYSATASDVRNPDLVFDREWALETVGAALRSLRLEMTKAGKRELFETLKGTLTGGAEPSRRDMAARLGMSEGAVKVAVHRIRRRYAELLRAAIAETVEDEESLRDEMRYLIEVLRMETEI